MGGSMPYQLEKGPYFSITESVLEDEQMRIDLLARIRRKESFDTMPSLDDPSLDRGPWKTIRERLEHQNEDWYGKSKQGSAWTNQPPFDIDQNRTTGYWYNWYGDAEGIMREVFARAIEVSLGVPHDTSVYEASAISASAVRCWPIDVYWRCPAPWFEGWVTWQQHPQDANDGHVIVHMHTPSHHDSALLLSPIRGAPQNTYPDYGQDPGPPPLRPSPYGKRGMWVVAHENQREHNSYSQTGGTLGVWDLPSFGPLVESWGPIVVVQPNEPDGGVLSAGRPYGP